MLTPILFVHYGETWIRGSERCLLDLLTRLDIQQYLPIVWSNNQALLTQVALLNVTVYFTPFTLLGGWSSPRCDLRAYWRLIRQTSHIIREHKIKLIHCNSGAPCQWVVPVARSYHLPLLAHLHARYQPRDRYSLLLHQVSCVVGVSRPVIEGLIDDGVPNERLNVIYNGIDADRLASHSIVDIRQHFGIPEKRLLLITVGSLIARKGMDILINAIKQLRDKQCDVALVMLGEGDAHFALTQQIHDLGVMQYVFLGGEITDVGGWLRGGADIMVSAAREEVFGLVLAEAGWAGLPVIAPKVGGIPDVVADQLSGVLFPAEDVNALVAAIEQLYNSPEQRLQMGKAGQLRVSQQFSVERYVQDIQVIYQQLLTNSTTYLTWYNGWRCFPGLLRWVWLRMCAFFSRGTK
ncbi:MAG: glycosyltransferase family 4 protein [Plesiomonas sp.]|uniref:glycosyltransferase family 4 protein n=1 Tax=Plesiomonas sp. TaxID=2486279 RepID=UPI003F3FC48A